MVSQAARGVGAVLLLCGSNAFMTTAWYLHLKFPSWNLAKAIFLSWLIAFFEYCLQVPANRMGHIGEGGPFSAAQLKIIQEFISLTAFAIFSVLVLKEKLSWFDLGAFVLIMAGVAVGMAGKPPEKAATVPLTPPAVEAPPPQPEPGGRRLQQLQLRLLPAAGDRGSSGSGSTGGGSSQGQESPGGPAGLPAGALHAVHEPLHSMASAHVLVAGDADVLAGSSQQGMRRRELTVDVEAGQPDGDGKQTSEAVAAAAADTSGSARAAGEAGTPRGPATSQ